MARQRTVIRNSVIITIDKKLGDFEQADLLIEDDIIAAVGPNLPVEDAQIIDGSAMIVLPGLIDSHRHTWQSVIRGISSDWTLGQYFERIRGGISLAYRPEDVYACDLDRVYRLAVETRDHLFAATGVPPGSTPVGLPHVHKFGAGYRS